MKKLTTLFIALIILTGCAAVQTLLGKITKDAKQTFISAGGTSIEIIENNAGSPKRVQTA